jgi:hypothetical protein
VRRHRQQDEGEHLAQVVVDLAEVGQLPDQIEEGEQAEEPEQHEAHRGVDLARKVALEGAGGHPYRRLICRLICPTAGG